MTIYEVSKRLNECANRHCGNCKYMYTDITEAECKTLLVRDMGAECERIGNELKGKDDE